MPADPQACECSSTCSDVMLVNNRVNKRRFLSDGCHNITEKANIYFVPNLYIFSRDTSKHTRL